MKPRPLESFWKSLPGLKRALSLKLGKFVKIGTKKFSAIALLQGEGDNVFYSFNKPMQY